jgi:hypothetical protein
MVALLCGVLCDQLLGQIIVKIRGLEIGFRLLIDNGSAHKYPFRPITHGLRGAVI